LMAEDANELHRLAVCLNETSHVGFGSAQPTDSAQPTGSSLPMGSAQPTAPTRSLSEAEGSTSHLGSDDGGRITGKPAHPRS
jgi:hypothetical protein